MRVHLDCFPCFLRQTLIAARFGTKEESLHFALINEVLDEIKSTDLSRPPAYSTTFLHRRIRHFLNKDPFKDIKQEYNTIALSIYSQLKKQVKHSSDPLWTASRLAIAGNVIDFGIFTSVDILGTIERALNSPIPVDHYESFEKSIERNEEVLYLLDNAGEIVFDRILIEELIEKGKKVIAVVKGEPVLNDCTMEDAEQVGLKNVCEIIDNGSDCVGTILEMTSAEFNKIFSNSKLIISKGQGNFETLYDTDYIKEKESYFLFQSKCDVVSKELGLSKGSMLLMKI
jgi:uncharacterized protein with ATP-grasp and redox domains